MAKPMTKAQIVAHLARKVGTQKKTAALFIDELFTLAVKEAKGGAGKFVIPGLARVVKAHRKARMGRNPFTGETIKIKAKTVLRLRASKAFKDAVINGTDDPGPRFGNTGSPGKRKKRY
jgi:DNA-binding protein HU-beta